MGRDCKTCDSLKDDFYCWQDGRGLRHTAPIEEPKNRIHLLEHRDPESTSQKSLIWGRFRWEFGYYYDRVWVDGCKKWVWTHNPNIMLNFGFWYFGNTGSDRVVFERRYVHCLLFFFSDMDLIWSVIIDNRNL